MHIYLYFQKLIISVKNLADNKEQRNYQTVPDCMLLDK